MSKKIIYDPFEWQGLAPAPIIGVDEVGRGCLAGRVYAAAVILDESKNLDIYTDSKKLTAKRREELTEIILKDHQWGLGFASVEEVDEINIFRAALLAMKRAVEELGVSSGHVVVDGSHTIPDLVGFAQTSLVKGDLRCAPVAAASILAKVTRDKYISDLGEEFPQYGFEGHKGYATKVHKEAIKLHGPCRVHRKTFAGVKEYL